MTLPQMTVLGMVATFIIVWVVMWHLMHDPKPSTSKHSTTERSTKKRYSLETLKTATIVILIGLAFVQFRYAVLAKRADLQHSTAAYNFIKAVENSRASTIKLDSLSLDTAAVVLNNKLATKQDRIHAMRVVNLVLLHSLAYRNVDSATKVLTTSLHTNN